MATSQAQSATPETTLATPERAYGYQYFETMHHFDLLMMINSLVESALDSASRGEVPPKHFENLLLIYRDLYRGFCDQMEFKG